MRSLRPPPEPTPETLALGDTYGEPPPYVRFDRSPMPVTAMAADYLPGHVTNPHQHPHAQLIHAVHGVMVVCTAEGQWIVPPTRGMWMPRGTTHWIRMVAHARHVDAARYHALDPHGRARADADCLYPARCGTGSAAALHGARHIAIAA